MPGASRFFRGAVLRSTAVVPSAGSEQPNRKPATVSGGSLTTHRVKPDAAPQISIWTMS